MFLPLYPLPPSCLLNLTTHQYISSPGLPYFAQTDGFEKTEGVSGFERHSQMSRVVFLM